MAAVTESTTYKVLYTTYEVSITDSDSMDLPVFIYAAGQYVMIIYLGFTQVCTEVVRIQK